MRYPRTIKATEFKFQELEFSASRTKSQSSDCVVGSSRKIALRKLSRKSKTARRENNCKTSHTEAQAIMVCAHAQSGCMNVVIHARDLGDESTVT